MVRQVKSAAVVYVAALALASLSLVAVAFLLTRGAPTALGEVDPTPTPLIVAAAKAEFNYSAAAELRFPVTPGTKAFGTDLPGVVTSVALKPDVVVTQGQELYRVNNLPVRAIVGGAVLYRPIGREASGSDVSTLQRFLKAVGYSGVSDTGTVDQTTRAAITAYAKPFGGGNQFDPSWVVRLPDRFSPTDVMIAPGDRAPTRDGVIAETAPIPGNPTIKSDAAGPDGQWVFAYMGDTVPVLRADGVFTLPKPGDARALAAHKQVIEQAITIAGRVLLATPVSAVAVPASAIMTEGDKSCVVSNGALVQVTVAGASPVGEALIASGVNDGDQILVNPAQMHQRCR